jgi:hypothetical protein
MAYLQAVSRCRPVAATATEGGKKSHRSLVLIDMKQQYILLGIFAVAMLALALGGWVVQGARRA